MISYLFAYTPLKRKTPLCTAVGAVPGAMPPLIGWAAASGSISREAWILFATLFFWQLPHVMSIAWIYREDYARAGYLVLPNNGRAEHFMAWMTLVPSLALVVVSVTTVVIDKDLFQCLSTLILGFALLYYAARLAVLKSRTAARKLLRASIIYLLLEFLTLVLGKR